MKVAWNGGDGRLVAYQRQRCLGLGVGVVHDPPQVAVDALIGHDLRNMLDRGLVACPGTWTVSSSWRRRRSRYTSRCREMTFPVV